MQSTMILNKLSSYVNNISSGLSYRIAVILCKISHIVLLSASKFQNNDRIVCHDLIVHQGRKEFQYLNIMQECSSLATYENLYNTFLSNVLHATKFIDHSDSFLERCNGISIQRGHQAL